MREMDGSEELAQRYLRHCGFQRVVFEPEGDSKPPDFVADDEVAVEVRRLNQHESATAIGEKPKGLEELRIPLMKTVRRALHALGPSLDGESWFVSVSFRRPTASPRSMTALLQKRLEEFRNGSDRRACRLSIADGLSIDLLPASDAHANYFVWGGGVDRDAGGWVVPELERNLEICINDKTHKVAGIRKKYSVWWLVLVDHINYADHEVIQVPPHDWDKIVLLDPRDHTRAFELP